MWDVSGLIRRKGWIKKKWNIVWWSYIYNQLFKSSDIFTTLLS